MSQKPAVILVVEDNPASAMAVVNTLNRLGHETEHVSTGKEAIERASNNNYILILMDIGLPDISGLEATKIIRQLDHPLRSQTPIIALTAHADKQTICLGAGMQGLIKKPVSTKQVKQVLNDYITPLNRSVEAPAMSEKDLLKIKNSKFANYQLREAVIADLKNKRHELVNAYRARNSRSLRRVLHHLKGGVCYVEAPTLMNALVQFHTAVKDYFQDKELLESKYRLVMEAIDSFCDDE